MSSGTESILGVIGLGTLCSASLVTGGAIASFWPPSATVRSSIQHIAAGFVFAAVSVEVLPDVIHRDQPFAAALGFAIGVALMLAIRTVAEKWGQSREGQGSNWTMVSVIAVDILVDGLLVGVSSVTGDGQQALLVTIALSVELFSLGLSMAASLGTGQNSRQRVIGITCLVAISPLVGSVSGFFLGKMLSGGWFEGILAFSAAALLYLAAEELLKEAHEVPETTMSTGLFFAAFLALLLIDMVSKGASS